MSSPSYKSRIDQKVKDKMRGWPLTRSERVGVLARLLSELPANPDRLLTEAIRRPNLWAFRFTLPGQPVRLLSFAVERRDYDGVLLITDADLSTQP
jgi:hypothetical protein